MGAQDTKQYLAAVVVNMYMLGFGILHRWTGEEYDYHVNRLHRDEGHSFQEYILPLYMHFAASSVGVIFFGLIAMKFGRKTSLMCMSIPMIISCLLNMFTSEFTFIKVSLVLNHVVRSIEIIGPLFLMEIVNDRFRGAILASCILPNFLGQMIALGGAIFFHSAFILWVVILFTVVVATGLLYRYFPDTPLWLIKNKRFEAAEQSIRFYKNIRKADENQMEIFKKEFDRVKDAATFGDLEANAVDAFQWTDFKTKHARKALTIGMVLMVLNVCVGNEFIAFHSVVTLVQSPMEFSMNMSKFIGLGVAFLGACTGVQMVDRVGRKALITISAVASSLALFGYTAYTIIGSKYTQTLTDWIPVITLLLSIFFGALGIQSLTWTVCIEILPKKLKDIGLIFCGVFYWMLFCAFVAIVNAFMYSGDGGIELIAGIACLVGAIIIHLMLAETKGKSRQEIAKSF